MFIYVTKDPRFRVGGSVGEVRIQEQFGISISDILIMAESNKEADSCSSFYLKQQDNLLPAYISSWKQDYLISRPLFQAGLIMHRMPGIMYIEPEPFVQQRSNIALHVWDDSLINLLQYLESSIRKHKYIPIGTILTTGRTWRRSPFVRRKNIHWAGCSAIS